MAGTQRGFNGDVFRDKIRFAMEMGAPPEDERRITFHFAETVTFTGRSDGDNVPFDPNVPITRTVRAPVTVPCVVEFQRVGDEITAFGVVVPARVKVLLLDEDYEQVKDSSYVIINGDRYNRHYEPPAFGLFSVGLHEIVFIAQDER